MKATRRVVTLGRRLQRRRSSDNHWRDAQLATPWSMQQNAI